MQEVAAEAGLQLVSLVSTMSESWTYIQQERAVEQVVHQEREVHHQRQHLELAID